MIGLNYNDGGDGRVLVIPIEEIPLILPYLSYSTYLYTKLIDRPESEQVLGWVERMLKTATFSPNTYQSALLAIEGKECVAVGIKYNNLHPRFHISELDLLDRRLPHREQTTVGKSLTEGIYLILNGDVPTYNSSHSFAAYQNVLRMNFSTLLPKVFPPLADLTEWTSTAMRVVDTLTTPRMSRTRVLKHLGGVI